MTIWAYTSSTWPLGIHFDSFFDTTFFLFKILTKLCENEHLIYMHVTTLMHECWNSYLILSFIKSTFVTWQADQKLTYALVHCNPRSEANIRFGSGVPAAFILHFVQFMSRSQLMILLSKKNLWCFYGS